MGDGLTESEQRELDELFAEGLDGCALVHRQTVRKLLAELAAAQEQLRGQEFIIRQLSESISAAKDAHLRDLVLPDGAVAKAEQRGYLRGKGEGFAEGFAEGVEAAIARVDAERRYFDGGTSPEATFAALCMGKAIDAIRAIKPATPEPKANVRRGMRAIELATSEEAAVRDALRCPLAGCCIPEPHDHHTDDPAAASPEPKPEHWCCDHYIGYGTACQRCGKECGCGACEKERAGEGGGEPNGSDFIG